MSNPRFGSNGYSVFFNKVFSMSKRRTDSAFGGIESISTLMVVGLFRDTAGEYKILTSLENVNTMKIRTYLFSKPH